MDFPEFLAGRGPGSGNRRRRRQDAFEEHEVILRLPQKLQSGLPATEQARDTLEGRMLTHSESRTMNSRPVEALGPKEARFVYQAMLFLIHLLLSLAVWALSFLAITLFHPDFVPPAVTLAVSFAVPLVVAFFVVKLYPSESATLPWMMGLVWFMLWGLHVLDMPTGPMACYHCGATEKLWLTFLSLNSDSGLLDGQGRFIATWPTVAMIGYSLGAKLGLRGADVPFENS